MLEGLRPIREAELAHGTAMNLDAHRDQFSPYSRMNQVSRGPTESGALWVDPNYGLVYGDWIEEGGAPYGVTELMPQRPLDEAAELGFLRVPFARFPRLAVRSQHEVESILDQFRRTLPSGAQVLLRGQTREFTLGRPRDALEGLYGSPEVIEPSLTTSASRHGIDVNAIMPEWTGVLQFLLGTAPWGDSGEDRRAKLSAWFHSYAFSRFAFSMAQHYGLPSSGLDVTPDVGVALFFALNRFAAISEGEGLGQYLEKSDWTHRSVIYVFAIPTPHHAVDFEGWHPTDLPATRPTRQRAFFLHRGWGLCRNDCARQLAFAMYLDEGFEVGEVPSGSWLFPDAKEDLFAAALGAFRRPGLISPQLQEFLGHLYWVED